MLGCNLFREPNSDKSSWWCYVSGVPSMLAPVPSACGTFMRPSPCCHTVLVPCKSFSFHHSGSSPFTFT